MPDDDRLSPAEARILEVREHFLTARLDFDRAQRRPDLPSSCWSTAPW
jgi:hypothetical protein